MPNRWISYVKQWAKKHGLSYGCALSQPQLKIDYKKAYPTKAQEKFRQSVERGEMGDEDILSSKQNIVNKKLADKTKRLQASRERFGMIGEDLLSQLARERDIKKTKIEASRNKLGMLQEDLLSRLAQKADQTKKLRGRLTNDLKAKQDEMRRNIEISRLMGEDIDVGKKQKKPTFVIEESDDENIPIKRRGRPKKYASFEEARTARIEKTKESNKRMRALRKQLEANN